MTEPQVKKRSKRRWVWPIASVLAVSVAFGGGMATGAEMKDPKDSEDYRLVSQARDRLSDQVSELRGQLEAKDAELQEQEGAMAEREAAVEEAEQAAEEREASLAEREEQVTAAEEQKAANTVTEGTWTVGVDIEPGTYRSDETVSSSCYWGIYRTGTNGSDIIENDIPGGGRPTVTVSEGHDFTTRRCGTWSKQ